MSSPTSPLSLLVVALAIIGPHLLLAHYYLDLPLYPTSPLSIQVPEPARSLCVLSAFSLVLAVIVKPIALNVAISFDKRSWDRYRASWIASNVQVVAFGVLWVAIIYTRSEDGSRPSDDLIGTSAGLLAGLFTVTNCE